MTARGFYTLFFGVIMLLTALSIGSAAVFLLGVIALIAPLVSFLSVLIAFFTLQIRQEVDVSDVLRGERCVYTLTVRLISPLPVAPLSLLLCLPSGRQSEFTLSTRFFAPTVSENHFLCPHVGIHPVGAISVRVSDCFSLFSFSRRIRVPLSPVTVLPVPLQVEPLTFSPGEGEASAIERAQADPTTPTDTRTWQEGDELKRVHWKLSMRKQQLIVHTFEQNQRPDALVLLDCSTPSCPANRRSAMLDALTETCSGVIKVLLEEGHTVRMPLSDQTTRETSALSPDDFGKMNRELATLTFSHQEEFARILLLSARRMRRTGSTAILSTHLTPSVADNVIALSKMGPHTYFYLVTAGETTPEQEKLLYLLTASGVEARHVAAQ